MFNFNEKVIFKKFLVDNSYFFLFTSLSMAMIVWVIQAVNQLDIVSEDGHSFTIYFSYMVLNLPKIFGKILPMIFFTSLFYTLVKYENNNELKIYWLNGINKFKFFNIILKYSIIFFILQIFINSFLGPYLQNKSRIFIKDSSLDFFPSLLQEKKFVDTVDKLTIFIEKKTTKTNFENIFLKDETVGNTSRLIFAKEGELIESNNSRIIRLNDGKFINVRKEYKTNDKSTLEQRTTTFNFSQTDFDLSKFVTKSITYRKLQELDSKALFSCVNYFYIKNKTYPGDDINCNAESISEIKQEIYSRNFKPLYLFLLVVIVSFLLTSNVESSAYKILKLFVFVAGVVVIIFSEISVSFSGLNDVNSLIAATLPFILFLILYIILKSKISYSSTKTS